MKIISVWRYFKHKKNNEDESEDSLLLSNRVIPLKWDKGVEDGSELYTHRKYSCTSSNSFHHVCECLNRYDPNAPVKWTPRRLAYTVLSKGKFTSFDFLFYLSQLKILFKCCYFFRCLSRTLTFLPSMIFLIIFLIIIIIIIAV